MESKSQDELFRLVDEGDNISFDFTRRKDGGVPMCARALNVLIMHARRGRLQESSDTRLSREYR